MPFVFILLFLASGHVFLLDPQNPDNGGQTPKNGQYLTVSEFYDQLNLQHQNTEALRRYVDKVLGTLTLQIQQKFTNLDNQIGINNNCNCSSESTDELQHHFHNLEDNNAKLLTKIDELTRKYEKQEQEKIALETKVAELTRDHASSQDLLALYNITLDLKQDTELLKNNHTRITHDLGTQFTDLSRHVNDIDIQFNNSLVQMQHDISDRARSVNSSIESINQRIENNSEQGGKVRYMEPEII